MEAPGPWMVIASFPGGQELGLLEAVFRDRAIPYRLRDALSVQIAPHLAGALGGVRLEVPENYREEATDALLDLGLAQLESAPENPILNSFERTTASWPVIGKWPTGPRLLLVCALLSTLVAVTLYGLLGSR